MHSIFVKLGPFLRRTFMIFKLKKGLTLSPFCYIASLFSIIVKKPVDAPITDKIIPKNIDIKNKQKYERAKLRLLTLELSNE
jgi:hypothetical protein